MQTEGSVAPLTGCDRLMRGVLSVRPGVIDTDLSVHLAEVHELLDELNELRKEGKSTINSAEFKADYLAHPLAVMYYNDTFEGHNKSTRRFHVYVFLLADDRVVCILIRPYELRCHFECHVFGNPRLYEGTTIEFVRELKDRAGWAAIVHQWKSWTTICDKLMNGDINIQPKDVDTDLSAHLEDVNALLDRKQRRREKISFQENTVIAVEEFRAKYFVNPVEAMYCYFTYDGSGEMRGKPLRIHKYAFLLDDGRVTSIDLTYVCRLECDVFADAEKYGRSEKGLRDNAAWDAVVQRWKSRKAPVGKKTKLHDDLCHTRVDGPPEMLRVFSSAAAVLRFSVRDGLEVCIVRHLPLGGHYATGALTMYRIQNGRALTETGVEPSEVSNNITHLWEAHMTEEEKEQFYNKANHSDALTQFLLGRGLQPNGSDRAQGY